MSYLVTVFLEEGAHARGIRLPGPVLCIQPDGGLRNGLSLQFTSGLPDEERAAIADRFLATVQEWRDNIVGGIAAERTAVQELAAARQEIARLKGERPTKARNSEAGDLS